MYVQLLLADPDGCAHGYRRSPSGCVYTIEKALAINDWQAISHARQNAADFIAQWKRRYHINRVYTNRRGSELWQRAEFPIRSNIEGLWIRLAFRPDSSTPTWAGLGKLINIIQTGQNPHSWVMLFYTSCFNSGTTSIASQSCSWESLVR